MKYDSKFEDFYNKLINEAPKPSEELQRKAKREKFKSTIGEGIIIIVCVLALIAAVTWMEFSEEFGKYFFVSFFAICFILFFLMSSNKATIEYTKIFKENIVKRVVEYFGPFSYMPLGNIPKSDYDSANFGESYDIYESEDLIVGNIEDIKLAMAEIKLIDEYTDEDGHTTYTTKYDGLFSRVNLNSQLDADIYILDRKKNFKRDYRFDYIKVNADSEEFNREFSLYSNNDVVALQLLTSDIMQKIVELKKEMNINYEIIFKNNSIYFRFETGSMFEVKNYNDYFDKDTIYRYFKVMEFTISISKSIIKILKESDL